MLQTKSKEFRKSFLLQFTKELIKHSGASEIFELENVLKQESKEIKKDIKEKLKEKKPLLLTNIKIPIRPPIQKILPPRVLRIPKPKLPSSFQYLKPTPTNTQIDLGKLNPLIQDPIVKSIECNGADENIMVRGNMGMKKTNIILTKEEINNIIKKFSETAKIPIQEGIFKVAIGKLILSAIISEVISSKFTIRKMMYSPKMNFGK